MSGCQDSRCPDEVLDSLAVTAVNLQNLELARFTVPADHGPGIACHDASATQAVWSAAEPERPGPSTAAHGRSGRHWHADGDSGAGTAGRRSP